MPPRRKTNAGQGELPGMPTMADPKEILWKAADKLRGSTDAAQYKDFVLGLVFLKYVSDSFEERRRQIRDELIADGVPEPRHESFLDDKDGSGGMFVQAEKFVLSHRGRRDDIAVYGQEANERTWRLAKMNLAIHGITGDLSTRWADTFYEDKHPDVKADYVMANPPFNMSDWYRKTDDPRWRFGTPPAGNANFGWIQHIIAKLGTRGSAGIVMANGSMSSKQSGEGEIRAAMVEADLVACMVALPPRLFRTTQIPACLWFFAKDKTARGRPDRPAGPGALHRRPHHGHHAGPHRAGPHCRRHRQDR